MKNKKEEKFWTNQHWAGARQYIKKSEFNAYGRPSPLFSGTFSLAQERKSPAAGWCSVKAEAPHFLGNIRAWLEPVL